MRANIKEGSVGRLLSVAMVLIAAEAATAGTWVEFDTSATLACRRLEAADPLHPGDSLWEARFRISTLVREGEPDNLLQCFITMEAPDSFIRVTDYEPKTTLQSNVAGGIAVHQRGEQTRSLGLAVTGSFESLAKLTGDASVGGKTSKDLKYELAAPQELVAASGTIRRGQGVYFKLKPTRQSTLEGGKEFVVRFRAPETWRASRVRIRCQATAFAKGITPLLIERVTRTSEFAVTLFAGGDKEAKAAAQFAANAEQQLRVEAARHRDAIQRRSHPSPLHQVGAMLSLRKGRIPDDWLQRLIAQPTAPRKVDLFRLPETVRAAATQFITAAQAVEHLNGA